MNGGNSDALKKSVQLGHIVAFKPQFPKEDPIDLSSVSSEDSTKTIQARITFRGPIKIKFEESWGRSGPGGWRGGVGSARRDIDGDRGQMGEPKENKALFLGVGLEIRILQVRE